uniref:Calmodulin n=1 Tax=Strongyloides papillosus TaxID=174720 RepID=A0A0N5BBK4_STREA
MGCCVAKEAKLMKKTKVATPPVIFNQIHDSDALIEITALFEKFDLNSNGFIERNELKNVMESMDGKVTESEIDNMFLVADKNKDGKIDFEEFKELIWANNDVLSIQTTFRTLDSNRDGFITKDDLITALKNGIITNEVYNSVTKYLESDNKVSLGFSEFYSLMPSEHRYLL